MYITVLFHCSCLLEILATVLSWHIINIQKNQEKIQGMEEIKKYLQDKGTQCIANKYTDDYIM